MRILLCLAVLLAFLMPLSGGALAVDTLINSRPEPAPAPPRTLVPGTLVRLPDGRQTRIIEVLPDGIRTELGVTLTREGMVAGAAEAGPVTVVEEAVALAAPETTLASPESPAMAPETAAHMSPQSPLAPEQQKAENAGPEIVMSEAQATSPETAHVTPDTPVTPGAAESDPHQLTIADLLPTTPAEDEPKAEKKRAKEEVKEKPRAKEKKAPAKAEKPTAEKPREARPKEQAKSRESRKKPAIGEELRIPPEAVATGNLDFLEGCWQGTRPEYYSKRIIKECFCFGANGGAGKRRVIDPIGGRRCIGSTKARLSKEGALFVTSSGAACSDGERWGQAEMVCRGTGQRAPCSWVFKDAQGGRQSYEIPFVRVESCGR